jgi:hypothetical protein
MLLAARAKVQKISIKRRITTMRPIRKITPIVPPKNLSIELSRLSWLIDCLHAAKTIPVETCRLD